VGPRAGLEALVSSKFPAPTGTRTPDHPTRSPALYRWAIPLPHRLILEKKKIRTGIFKLRRFCSQNYKCELLEYLLIHSIHFPVPKTLRQFVYFYVYKYTFMNLGKSIKSQNVIWSLQFVNLYITNTIMDVFGKPNMWGTLATLTVKVKVVPVLSEVPRHEGVMGEWRHSSTYSWPRH
jgi:hypothetical protein